MHDLSQAPALATLATGKFHRQFADSSRSVGDALFQLLVERSHSRFALPKGALSRPLSRGVVVDGQHERLVAILDDVGLNAGGAEHPIFRPDPDLHLRDVTRLPERAQHFRPLGIVDVQGQLARRPADNLLARVSERRK
jgi:hypothetical protein